MSYLAQEQSVSSGTPLELYEFTYGAESWRYTSGDTSFFETIGSRTYLPLVVQRPDLVFTSDYGKTSIDLVVDTDADFLQLYKNVPPTGVVLLNIKRVHRNDLAAEIVTIWSGRVINVSWATRQATVTCETILSSIQRFGLRRTFQLQCPHVLYSAACGASKALFMESGNVLTLSGSTLTASGIGARPDGYFAGGYIEWDSAEISATERRMITASFNGTSQLILMAPPVGLEVGMAVKMYPGCDHTITTCDTKFANSANFGGFPYTPSKSPFSGEVVF